MIDQNSNVDIEQKRIRELEVIDEGRVKFDRRLATELVSANDHIHLLELKLAQSEAALDATYRVLFSILIIYTLYLLTRTSPPTPSIVTT